MTQLFVKNTQPRLVSLCAILPPPKPELKPIRETVQLGPGVNPVSEAFWKEAKKVVAVQALIEEGTLEEMGQTQDGKIAALAEGEAVRIVNATYSIKLLGGWLLEEKRAKVKAAIQKQLDTIERETKPEEKKGES